MSPESRSPGTNGSNLEEVCTGYASDRAAVIALRASRRRRADGNVKRNDAVLVVVRGGKTVREPGQAARRSVVSTHAQRQSPLQNRYECTVRTAFVGPARRCVPGMRARFCWCQRPCGDAASRRRTPRSIGRQKQLHLRGRAPKRSVADKHQQSRAHFASGGPQNHCSAGVGVRCGPPHHPRPPPAWPWTPPGLWDHSGGGGEAPWPTCGAPWLLLPIELDPTPCYIWVPGGRPV